MLIHSTRDNAETSYLQIWPQGELPVQEVIGGLFGRLFPLTINKVWGREEVSINVEGLYCMKALYFNSYCSTSVHFHCSKHESFYVSRGTIEITLYNKGVVDNKIILQEGDSYVVPPGLVHRIKNISDGEACIIEASTFSRDIDSIRIDPDVFKD